MRSLLSSVGAAALALLIAGSAALCTAGELKANLTPDLRGGKEGLGQENGSSGDLAEPGSRPRFVPGEIIVMFKDGVDEAAIARLNSDLGTSVLYTSPYLGFERIRIPADKTVPEMVEIYSQDPRVEYAEPNGIAYAFYTPNDPLFPYQWHFLNIDMESAWNIQQGQSSIKVGILDTGVAYEDFAIPAYEAGEVLSGDGMYHQAPDLASTVFVPGYDYIHNDNHPNDQHGHGTHVAGTVAESTDDGYGVAGMAFGVSIMPVQVLGYNGSGPVAAIADGIAGAHLNGAHVINMSLGGPPGDSSGFHTVHLAMIDAWNGGVVICCATGNDNASQISYPAAWDECIAVGAVRFDSTRSPYSNYGTGIDIVAPGGDVTVDQNGDGYADGVLQETYLYYYDWGGGGELCWVDEFIWWFWQGTSMATPHVAALSALLICRGASGPDNIKSIIEQTATDLGPGGYDLWYGHGLINPVEALSVGISEGEISRRRDGFRLSLESMPNPFSRSSTIRYELSGPGQVALKVYDLNGRLVKVLVNEEKAAGPHSICWDGEGLPSGLYFLNLRVGEKSHTQKVTLLR